MKYAALLRGIGPSNPNMRNEKLREVFQNLGFQNVQTVISSGNVLFESPARGVKALEAAIEEAIQEQLGFASTTIIRSHQQLRRLVDNDPFGGIEDTPTSRLNVTFLKVKRRTDLRFPYPRRKQGLYGHSHARSGSLQRRRSHRSHNAGSHGLAREAVRQSNHYPHMEDGREGVEPTRFRRPITARSSSWQNPYQSRRIVTSRRRRRSGSATMSISVIFCLSF
jgi:hypothetical protein